CEALDEHGEGHDCLPALRGRAGPVKPENLLGVLRLGSIDGQEHIIAGELRASEEQGIPVHKARIVSSGAIVPVPSHTEFRVVYIATSTYVGPNPLHHFSRAE